LDLYFSERHRNHFFFKGTFIKWKWIVKYHHIAIEPDLFKSRAQDLLRQGLTYLDRDSDVEACESLK